MKQKKKLQNLLVRPPIVTVMGHVDHGKTSILDAIRNTSVTAKEHGGITQHTAAYQVVYKGKTITFIDTPGHEVFTQMRARGGSAADIVILVVAVNDGVMPQTIEAINHAKAGGAKIIVALNKIDISGVNMQKVKQQLADNNVILEELGGDTVAVEVSAKQKKNLDNLLEAISLTAEMENYTYNPTDPFKAIVVESNLDKKKGPLVWAIVKANKISVGEKIYVQKTECKVKALNDFNGKPIKTALVSMPVEILGFKEVINMGSIITKDNLGKKESAAAKEDVNKKSENTLNVVIKADVQGTLEAILTSVHKIKADETSAICVLHSGVGDVNQSDVLLASTAKAVIVAFNVEVSNSVAYIAKNNKVLIRKYNIIYKLIEELAGALEGVVEMEEEKIKGRAEIIEVFRLPSKDIIAGASVFAGLFRVGDKISIWESEEKLKKHLKNPKDEPDGYLFKTKIKKIKFEKSFVEKAPAIKNYGFLFNPMYKDINKGMVIHKH